MPTTGFPIFFTPFHLNIYEFIGPIIGSFIHSPSKHRVLHSAILHRKRSDLHTCAHLVLLRHFQSETAGATQFILGHQGFLSDDARRIFGLQSAVVLLGPA